MPDRAWHRQMFTVRGRQQQASPVAPSTSTPSRTTTSATSSGVRARASAAVVCPSRAVVAVARCNVARRCSSSSMRVSNGTIGCGEGRRRHRGAGRSPPGRTAAEKLMRRRRFQGQQTGRPALGVGLVQRRQIPLPRRRGRYRQMQGQPRPGRPGAGGVHGLPLDRIPGVGEIVHDRPHQVRQMLGHPRAAVFVRRGQGELADEVIDVRLRRTSRLVGMSPSETSKRGSADGSSSRDQAVDRSSRTSSWGGGSAPAPVPPRRPCRSRRCQDPRPSEPPPPRPEQGRGPSCSSCSRIGLTGGRGLPS